MYDASRALVCQGAQSGPFWFPAVFRTEVTGHFWNTTNQLVRNSSAINMDPLDRFRACRDWEGVIFAAREVVGLVFRQGKVTP